MLFWDLFIQTLAMVLAIMFIGAGLSWMLGKKDNGLESEGGKDGA